MRSCPVSVDIRQQAVTPGALSEYARISIAFMVDRVLEVTLVDGGLGGVSLAEAPLVQPYRKDYDAIEGQGPAHWAERFDISSWAMIGAYRDDARLGGAVVAFCLKIETQNVNAAACRFYRKMGCTLGAIDRFAYDELPGEVQLLWQKELQAPE
jgi:hypothetical protein